MGTQIVCMREKKQYTSLHSEDQESSRTIPRVGEAVHSVLVSLEGMHHGTHTHIVHLQNHNTHIHTYSTLNEMIFVCVVCYSACNLASFPGHPQLPSSLLGMRQECILSPIIIVCSCHEASPS